MRTRVAVHRITSSPARQASSSRLVVSTRVCCPEFGSRFCDSAVRVLLWKGAGRARRAAEEGRDVFMPSSLFFLPKEVFAKAYECRNEFRKESEWKR